MPRAPEAVEGDRGAAHGPKPHISPCATPADSPETSQQYPPGCGGECELESTHWFGPIRSNSATAGAPKLGPGVLGVDHPKPAPLGALGLLQVASRPRPSSRGCAHRHPPNSARRGCHGRRRRREEAFLAAAKRPAAPLDRSHPRIPPAWPPATAGPLCGAARAPAGCRPRRHQRDGTEVCRTLARADGEARGGPSRPWAPLGRARPPLRPNPPHARPRSPSETYSSRPGMLGKPSTHAG